MARAPQDYSSETRQLIRRKRPVEEVHSVSRSHSTFTMFAAVVGVCLFAFCSCHNAAEGPPRQPHALSNAISATDALSEIGMIKDISPKIGAPQTDSHVIKVLSLGTNATPLLVQKIIDDTPSQFSDGFHYSIGDLAHRLLCDLYRRPLLWPVATNTPVGGFPEVTFQDYLALVHAPGGRAKLQQLWRDYLTSLQ